jgi:hypothetical protein
MDSALETLLGNVSVMNGWGRNTDGIDYSQQRVKI